MSFTTLEEDLAYLSTSTFPQKQSLLDFVHRGSGDLVHFANEYQLEFFQAVALVLKNEWQQFLLKKFALTSISELQPHNIPERKWEKIKKQFSPNPQILFELFEKENNWASSFGFDSTTFSLLIKEIIEAKLYLISIASDELQAFCARASKEKCLIEATSPEIKEQFWSAKSGWLQLHENLGEFLLVLESQRLRNANITTKWMRIFGEAYLSLQEQSLRFDSLHLKLELLKKNPALSREDLEKLINQHEEERLKELNTLRLAVAQAPFLRKTGLSVPFSQEEFASYRLESKKILRELWMLIHPDRLSHHPDFEKLTPVQKEELGKIWHQVMEIRQDECGFEPGDLNYEYRSLVILHDALATAKAILAASGIDTDVRLLIQGETITEQLLWLEKEKQRLESEIEAIQVELKVLLEDKDIRRKITLLNISQEHQEKTKDQMLQHACRYEIDADAVEAQINDIFKKRETV